MGPQINKVAPLKSSTGQQITNRKEQLDGLVEHYSDLYSEERSVDNSLEEIIPQLPVMTELDAAWMSWLKPLMSFQVENLQGTTAYLQRC